MKTVKKAKKKVVNAELTPTFAKAAKGEVVPPAKKVKTKVKPPVDSLANEALAKSNPKAKPTPVLIRRKKTKSKAKPKLPMELQCRLPMGSHFLGDRVTLNKDGKGEGKLHAYLAPVHIGNIDEGDNWMNSIKVVSPALKALKEKERNSILKWWLERVKFENRLVKSDYEYRFGMLKGNPPVPYLGFAPSTKGLTGKEVLKLCKEHNVS